MPQMRNPFRRTTVLARPKPCSFAEAQHSLDRLVAAGIDAEIVEHADNGLNMWANTKVGGEVTPDERYVIRGLGELVEGSTDADGKLIVDASIHTREITISLPDQNVSYPIAIGHMDPHQESSGARQRLENLGYFRTTGQDAADSAQSEAPADSALHAATIRFQREMGLETTGEIDAVTSKELSRAHGC